MCILEYEDLGVQVCNKISCASTCKRCAGRPANTCIECDYEDRKRELSNGFNSSCDCVEHYYYSSTFANVNCQICHYSCKDCDGSTRKNCVSCY